MSDGVARHHRTSSTPTMQGVGDGAIAKLRAAAATKRASKTSEKSGIGEEGTGRHGADKSVTGVSKSKILGPPSHTRSKEVKGTVSHARKASPSLSKTRIAKVSLSEIKRKARRSRGVSLENRSNPANGSEGVSAGCESDTWPTRSINTYTHNTGQRLVPLMNRIYRACCF